MCKAAEVVFASARRRGSDQLLKNRRYHPSNIIRVDHTSWNYPPLGRVKNWPSTIKVVAWLRQPQQRASSLAIANHTSAANGYINRWSYIWVAHVPVFDYESSLHCWDYRRHLHKRARKIEEVPRIAHWLRINFAFVLCIILAYLNSRQYYARKVFI